jgi:hypothetical protein
MREGREIKRAILPLALQRALSAGAWGNGQTKWIYYLGEGTLTLEPPQAKDCTKSVVLCKAFGSNPVPPHAPRPDDIATLLAMDRYTGGSDMVLVYPTCAWILATDENHGALSAEDCAALVEAYRTTTTKWAGETDPAVWIGALENYGIEAIYMEEFPTPGFTLHFSHPKDEDGHDPLKPMFDRGKFQKVPPGAHVSRTY